MNRPLSTCFLPWLPATLMCLLLSAPLRAAYRMEASVPDTVGLWARWHTGANTCLLEVTLQHQPATDMEPIRLVNVDIAWDPALFSAAGAPVPGQLFTGFPDVFHAWFDSPTGRTFTSTLLGPQAGATPAGPVTVFSQEFHALSPAGGPATLALSLDVRGALNQAIPCDAPLPLVIQVDTLPPVGYTLALEALSPAGNTTWTWLPTISQTLGGGDGSLHSLVNGENPLPPAAEQPDWQAPPLPPQFVLSPGNGHHDVYAHLRDRFGNVATVSAGILLDDQPPAAVGALTADPRHQGVQLDWSLPPDVDLDHVEIWRNGWQDSGVSAYPEYDDLVPLGAWPADRDDAIARGFSLVYSGSGTSHLDPQVPRDVYRYAAVAVDQAGLVSPIAPTARDRATNYFLGDFATPYSGTVHSADLNRLAAAYDTQHGQPAYNNQVDIGPSDDNGPRGIPLTDNRVDFEDLMLFAMNWSLTGPPLSAAGSEALDLALEAGSARLQWRNDGTRWSLWLEGGNVLGARITLADRDTPLDSPWPVFPRLGESGREVSLVSFDGGPLQGRLFSLEGNAPPALIGLDLRNTRNQAVETRLDPADSVMPSAFALYPASPNPFNPGTTIRFSLAEAGPASLVLFDLQGRRVRTLAGGDMPTGEHTTQLDATGLASGVYILNLQSGGSNSARRISLVR